MVSSVAQRFLLYNAKCVPLAIHPVLAQPVCERLIAWKAHQVGCLRLVPLGLIESTCQIVPWQLKSANPEAEAITEGTVENLGFFLALLPVATLPVRLRCVWWALKSRLQPYEAYFSTRGHCLAMVGD